MKSRASLLVAQSGGPTAVINSSLAGIITAARQSGRIERVIGLSGGLEGFFEGRTPLDLTGLSEAQLAALRTSNGTALGSCRFTPREEHFQLLLDFIRRHNIHYFLYIGGNGSMRTPLELARRAHAIGQSLICLGIPKTVDNDLFGTDFAPGYPSAARWLAHTTRDAGLDLIGMRGFDNIKIIEAMGRHSGWMAAATTLARTRPADPPHLLYLPEQPFEIERFLQDVATVYAWLGVALVVIAEGIRDKEGRFVAEMGGLPRDENGRALFSFTAGAASYLCGVITKELGLKARFDRPGTLQRGAACVSELDRQLAYEVGKRGVEMALEGAETQMVAIVRCSEPGAPYLARLEGIDLVEVAGHEKPLPPEWFGPDGSMDATMFEAYARPLIEPALPEPVRPDEFPLFNS
ncbi:MAG TPA: diphosphate--fructose-6-phosphate 1-phosphotransferase [Chloroflexia bacterium]|nr:diphosphate--fructose-6-phosphate 1-phosphotransferase [Chloroflexia bacterium]